MDTKELIIREIDNVPAKYLTEILDFIRFLEAKALEQKMDTALASETTLKKDWLRPEEDEAWHDL
ncbi:MAG: DUF2281 domain-containing protein [Dehalococcoidia bacterium]|nr:DUF2281 domain-containing protein [Dehalococcoidia bacterium]